MNFLTKLGIAVEHISEKERHAQAIALEMTSRVKQLLENKLTITAEAVIGGHAAVIGEAAHQLVNRLIPILESPVVANDLDMVAGTLGRWGALLTGAIHDGEAVKTGKLDRWILIFETLFHLNKKP